MQACPCSACPSVGTIPFVRVLNRKLCGKACYSRKSPPTCLHWGQLKLLLSEIEFLTPFYGQSLCVIYAGAAPGLHVPMLARMFPSMHFVLVDPAPSFVANGEYCNVEVIADFMTDTLAGDFAAKYGPNLLFISDVRVGATVENESDDAQQQRIQRDMDAQRGWLMVMRPLSSILKFRLPWCGGMSKYLSGRIHFPVYGKSLTHEARLVVPKNALDVEYEPQLYEQQMTYYNRVLRPSIYSTPIGGDPRCYDCTAFRWIVSAYTFVSTGGYHSTDDMCIAIEMELNLLKSKWAKIKH